MNKKLSANIDELTVELNTVAENSSRYDANIRSSINYQNTENLWLKNNSKSYKPRSRIVNLNKGTEVSI